MSGIYNVTPFRRFLDALASVRGDVVVVSDSNALFGGYGWDYGFAVALAEGYNTYATPLFSANENNGSGAGQGYGAWFNARGSPWGAITGAPAELHDLLDPGSGGLAPANYAYITSDVTTSSVPSGCQVGATWPGDIKGPLKARFWWGNFLDADTGTGNFRPHIRQEAAPWTVLAGGAQVTSKTGEGTRTLHETDISLAADATRAITISARFKRDGYNVTAPQFWLYCSVENTDRTAGFAVNTLDYRGGQPMRILATDLQEASDNTLLTYFGCLKTRQGAGGHVLVVLNSGLNDRNDDGNNSVGPSPADSATAAGFVDNMRAAITRLQAILTTAGFDASHRCILVMPSHPISAPDDAELVAYRAEAEALAADDVTVVRLDELTTYTAMAAADWYDVGGPAHLAPDGYVGVVSVIEAALLPGRRDNGIDPLLMGL